VHLALPIDVASAEVDPERVPRSVVQSGKVHVSGGGEAGLVEKAAELLKQAKRPLLVAGSGVYYSCGEQSLATFAQQQQIPIVVPIWDRGSVVEPLDVFMGVIGAATGGPQLLAEADVVILAGAEFDHRVGQISPPALGSEAKVIRIHADAARLRQGLEAHQSIQGAPGTVLAQLAEACRRLDCPPATQWLAEAQQRRRAHRQRCLHAAEQLTDGTNGADVVQAILEVMTDDALWLVDGGNIGQWFHQLVDRYPGHWLTCGASGVVGWGLPGAMAAKAMYPARPVILLSGDGAFTFTVAELESASRQGLNFVAVVADDQQWGISVTAHVKKYGQPLYSTLGPTRLDKVAEGFGCRGVYVERKTDLVPALCEALAADCPTVIQVPICPGSPAD
jgi:acetolactate synthase-1/2/3 large subunit